MSEIKFACPHCAQHVACDNDYAGISILCPACGKPMDVPVLSAQAADHPDLYLVASKPSLPRPPTTHLPRLDPWSERAWNEQADAATGEPAGRTPLWVVSALGTVILAAILRASGAAGPWVTLAVLLGTALSVYLVRKSDAADMDRGTVAYSIGRGLVSCVLVMVAIPVVALGVLFLGCVACH